MLTYVKTYASTVARHTPNAIRHKMISGITADKIGKKWFRISKHAERNGYTAAIEKFRHRLPFLTAIFRTLSYFGSKKHLRI